MTPEEEREITIRGIITVTVVLGALLTGATLLQTRPGDDSLPDFTQGTPAERKQQFFGYLEPIVSELNQGISQRRARLLDIAAELEMEGGVGWRDEAWLYRIAQDYRIDPIEDELDTEALVQLLLRRVDVIPASLVMVQAAKESGWGRSRFAREANNLFGERCYLDGCGVVPRARADGQRYQVESFPTVRASVQSYMRNLNSHERYRALRRARQNLRVADQDVTGLRLVDHLGAYSERRQDYINEVKGMIVQNDLESLPSGT